MMKPYPTYRQREVLQFRQNRAPSNQAADVVIGRRAFGKVVVVPDGVEAHTDGR